MIIPLKIDSEWATLQLANARKRKRRLIMSTRKKKQRMQ